MGVDRRKKRVNVKNTPQIASRFRQWSLLLAAVSTRMSALAQMCELLVHALSTCHEISAQPYETEASAKQQVGRSIGRSENWKYPIYRYQNLKCLYTVDVCIPF